MIFCLGICAGKHSVAKYLIENHGFQHLSVQGDVKQDPGYECHLSRKTFLEGSCQSFRTIDELLDFATARWNQRWVTTEKWDDELLDALLVRPYFLLLSIDAPITLRWRRFVDKCVAPFSQFFRCRFSANVEF